MSRHGHDDDVHAHHRARHPVVHAGRRLRLRKRRRTGLQIRRHPLLRRRRQRCASRQRVHLGRLRLLRRRDLLQPSGRRRGQHQFLDRRAGLRSGGVSGVARVYRRSDRGGHSLPCPGDDPGTSLSAQGTPTRTTTCTAAQESGVPTLAACQPLASAVAPSDAGEAASVAGLPITIDTTGFVLGDGGTLDCAAGYTAAQASFTAGSQGGQTAVTSCLDAPRRLAHSGGRHLRPHGQPLPGCRGGRDGLVHRRGVREPGRHRELPERSPFGFRRRSLTAPLAVTRGRH